MTIAQSDLQWWRGERARGVAVYALFGALSGSMAAVLIATEWFDD